MKRAVPLEVVVNGESTGVIDGGIFNSISLESDKLRTVNSVLIKRMADAGLKSEADFHGDVYIMSTEMEIECR